MTLGLTIFFYWLRLAWLRRVRPDASLKVKLATLFVITPLIIYPFTYGPVWWLRGLTGDLSILSTALLILAIIQMIWDKKWIIPKESKAMQWSIALLGLLFYPLALGLGQVDPYVWGYANPYMLGALLGLSIVAFAYAYYATAVIVLCVVLAWSLHVLDSNNIWDYLLDPFVFFFFVGKLVRCRRCI